MGRTRNIGGDMVMIRYHKRANQVKTHVGVLVSDLTLWDLLITSCGKRDVAYESHTFFYQFDKLVSPLKWRTSGKQLRFLSKYNDTLSHRMVATQTPTIGNTRQTMATPYRPTEALMCVRDHVVVVGAGLLKYLHFFTSLMGIICDKTNTNEQLQ